jgi:hypothetical protein
MDYIAIPWITDYLEELRSVIRECDRPQVIDGQEVYPLCIQCHEKERFVNRIEEILREHGR